MKMSRSVVAACCLAGMLSAIAGAAEMAIVPVKASMVHSIVGNEIILATAGQRVFLEIRISGWDPNLDGTPKLKTWEADLDSSGYSSGVQGTLAPALVSCTDEYDCRPAFGGVCSLAGGSCLVDTDCAYYAIGEICGGALCDYPTAVGGLCSPGFQFIGRIDGLLLRQLPAVDVSSLDFRFGATLSPSGQPFADPGTIRYGGTLVLDVPANAMGSFTIELKDISFMKDGNDVLILPLNLTSAIITISCQSNADCDDGLFCTGVETCGQQGCQPGVNPCTAPALPMCDEDADECVTCLRSGDVNGDRQIDLADAAMLPSCATAPVGPQDPPVYSAECRCLDVDGDGDIDLRDYAEFQLLFLRP